MTCNRGELRIECDQATLARAVADDVSACARNAIAERGRFDLALAGGSTPKAAYALLARREAYPNVDWERVRFFFSDERCVAPSDEQSNFKMANDALLRPLGIAESAIFRMHGEDEPAKAALAYASALRRELTGDERGTPVFDLILLGMGPDGHTASLFPGSDPYEDEADLVRAPYVEKFATYRLTFTPRLLESARAVSVAVAGEGKADAFAAVREERVDPKRYPIAVLQRATGRLTWFADRAAAARLT